MAIKGLWVLKLGTTVSSHSGHDFEGPGAESQDLFLESVGRFDLDEGFGLGCGAGCGLR